MAKGVVFDDANGNGRRDRGEQGIANVRVSNQYNIAVTDEDGRWTLPYDEDTIFYVVKPRGWMTPVNDQMLPQFYYIHKPGGSPDVRFGGVDPTGDLPDSIDFPLRRQKEPDQFSALFFGDTQVRNATEVDYLMRDIIEPLVGTKEASFGVTLGDLVFDDLSVFEPYNGAIAMIGLPWYNVLGNHDINYDVRTDKFSDETFERIYGPAYYSFDYGPTHFVVLDDVYWHINSENGRGRYTGAFGEQQLEWLRRDLEMVPKDQLVVLTMHIPLYSCSDKDEVLRLLEGRPSLSVSAHTHYQEHRFMNAEGSTAEPHHHVINVTTCGSWWQGRPDERGVPHTTMRDGAPNGYSLFTFDGNTYSIEFRAAGSDPSHQMNLYLPDTIQQGESTDLVVNVFGGTDKSTVEYRVGDEGPWQKMPRVDEPDPEYAKIVERDAGLTAPFRPLPAAINSPHLWKIKLPAFAEPGVVPVHVRTRDMFGQEYMATRGVRVLKP